MRQISGGIKFEVSDVTSVRGDATNEHNDCTVRALKHVVGVPYRDAHAMCARLGRKARKGMTSTQLLALIDQPHVYGYKVTRVILPMFCNTLGRAMMYLHTGRYLIVKTGHAIGCVDGVLYDATLSGPSSRIKMILKFELTSDIERRECASVASQERVMLVRVQDISTKGGF
jgi:hypothetical protein